MNQISKETPNAAQIFNMDNQFVFPREINEEHCPGMSLRDYFASRETLSDLDHPEASGWSSSMWAQLVGIEAPAYGTLEYVVWEAKARSALKYLRADAMIAARASKKQFDAGQNQVHWTVPFNLLEK